MKPLEHDKGGVIVTGASSGIGYALTQLLLRGGYYVSAWSRTPGRLSESPHPRLAVVPIDVRDKPAMDRAVCETVAAAGRLDGMVACAAAVFLVNRRA